MAPDEQLTPAGGPARVTDPAPYGVRYEIGRRPRKGLLVKIFACLALLLLLTGCIPIGARVSNMYAQAPAAAHGR